MTTTVAYLRVSTDDQALGLDAQRAMLTRYAERNGVTIVSWHVDEGVSGGAPLDERPGLMQALEAIAASKASALLVARRDRLARDVLAACTLERSCAQMGASIVCADGTGNGDTPEAQLMRRMIDAFAEYERAIIRGRIKAALAVKKARGELTGSAPLGYKAVKAPSGVKRLAPAEDELAAVREAQRLAATGISLRQVCVALAAKGHKPRSGGEWHPEQIRRMVG